MDREQLLKRLDLAWVALTESCAGLSDAELMEPGVTGAWSVRDIIAHVTWWEEEALTHLPVILAGGRPPRYSVTHGGIDAFNARMTEQKQDLSLPEVLRQRDDVHGRLVAFIGSVPDDEIAGETRFRRRLRLDTYGHYPKHARAIRKWREQRSAVGASGRGRPELWLPYHPPYDWPAALAFLAHRAIEGMEQVEGDVYRRTIHLDGVCGTVAIAHDEAGAGLHVTIRLPVDVADAIAGRLRRMFDLDVDPRVVAEYLARDPSLAPLLAARPGLRVLGGWDVFEVAARAIIGQQVAVARARVLLGILVHRCGGELPGGADGTLRRVFPTARQVLDGDLSAMGMPGARVTALKTMAEAALADPRLFERAHSIEQTVTRLRATGGIGDWTAHYIAMRACREPDAFPAGDVGLLRGGSDAAGRRPSPAELTVRADRWRPWRAYAAQHLWAADAAALTRTAAPRTPPG